MIAIKSIARVGGGAYDVVLEDEDRATRSFQFVVQDGDVQHVKWGADFSEYMNHNMVTVQALFKAVLAVHKAQHMTIRTDND